MRSKEVISTDIRNESPTDVIIDKMTADDIDAVHAIETGSFTMPWSESLFLEELRNPLSRPMVARTGGRLVGYLCSSLVMDEGQILDLAVHPSFRRQGVAGRLMNETLEHLRLQGCSKVFLEVRAGHSDVLRFYERYGFRAGNTRKCYYVSPPDDAVIMSLQLDKAAAERGLSEQMP